MLRNRGLNEELMVGERQRAAAATLLDATRLLWKSVSSMRWWPLFFVPFVACSKADAPDVILEFTAGKETDAWTATPIPARMVVTSSEGGGAPSTIADVAWPADSLSLGSVDAGASYTFAAELRDATGTLVMRGVTPSVGSDEASATSVPVFCGRLGQLGRTTDGLSLTWKAPLATFVESRLAVLMDGTQQSELYDFVYLSPLEPSATVPIAPRAMAPMPSDSLLLVGDTDIITYSLDDGTSGPVSVGVDASQLSGGSTVLGDDGTSFIVGATRNGAATTSVLRVETDGTVTAHSLQTARSQAMATWVHGTGLVVLGGAAVDTVEVLAAGGGNFVAQSAGVPTLVGGVAASVAANEVLVAGALDSNSVSVGVLRVSLSCSPCAAAALVADPIDLPAGIAFPVGSPNAFFVGTAMDGSTAAYLLTETAAAVTMTAVPLRAPRRSAAAVPLGDNRVAILGGVDASGAAVADVEIFTPP